jgi:hypothetical protein
MVDRGFAVSGGAGVVISKTVMPGLVPGIHVLIGGSK